MGLKERLETDMREALRERDLRRLSAIRMLRAAIGNYEIARTDRKSWIEDERSAKQQISTRSIRGRYLWKRLVTVH
jgi:uncharacterized protein YqeY